MAFTDPWAKNMPGYKAPSKPAPAKAPGTATTVTKAAPAWIHQLLDPIGLGSLATWAWQTYINAGDDALGKTLVLDQLSQQDAYKARFPAIADRAAKGLPPLDATHPEAAYMQYEESVRSAFIQYGLPLPTTGVGFNDVITGLLNNDVSASEVINQRIPSAFARVINAPPEVLSAAEGMFGANSKATLAAAFLNPNMDTNTIEQLSKASEVQGTAQRFGIDINAGRARQLTGLGADDNLGQFGQLALQRPLFDAQPGQSGQATLDQGINAAFGADATSQAAVERALQQRKALFAGGGEPYTSSSLSATPGIPGLGAGPT